VARRHNYIPFIATLVFGLILYLLRLRSATNRFSKTPPARKGETAPASKEERTALPSGDAMEVVRRIEDLFPTNYLTLLAIIQGVALGFLLSSVQSRWNGRIGWPDRLMITLQSLAVFIIIVVVTHRYTLLSIFVRRVPTGFDIFIPYLLGVSEIGAAQLIGYDSLWWGGILFFACAGIIVFLHSRRRTNRRVIGGDVIYSQFLRNTKRAILVLAALASTSAIIIILNALARMPDSFSAISPVVAVAAPLLIGIVSHYRLPVGEMKLRIGQCFLSPQPS
jgi:hypothetical protein